MPISRHVSGHPTRAPRSLALPALAIALAVGLTSAPSPAAAADEPGRPGNPGGLHPRTSFHMEADGSTGRTARGAAIPNVDSVKSTIRTYYRATDGIADKTSSPYIAEMRRIVQAQLADLPTVDPAARKAIVLDADDTTLWTYDMEDAAMAFNFDPALQDVFVQEQRFPATPGMVTFVEQAQARGYTIFGLTGRNDDQRTATIANLDKFYPDDAFDDARYFTKWTGEGESQQPPYITCAVAKCTTVEYKAGTRRHIEDDLGYDIALNVGDQWSDLMGGYGDVTLKLPNPTYYLPSPNLPGVDEPRLAPRTRFTMKPNGASGRTAGGEGIPNIDSVKATVRAYYGAVDGIAAKATSAYIRELKRRTATWATKVRTVCRRQAGRRATPAVVFDADDTTLWTYDMEDAGMAFDFDPALQDVYVQHRRFPRTPGMKRVVRAAVRGGCEVVGLTGRNDDQKRATLQNLRRYYGASFTRGLYFTKWTGEGKSRQPRYIRCAVRNDCTTVEYKSQTRRHVERDLGLRIVANFGDQFSDLKGGHADRSFKLPNPTYYLT